MPDTTTHITSSSDGLDVTVYRWEADDPRGIVQLTHGMGEHALRYDRLARALTAAGFAVVAQDHRGHGATADPAALGDLGAGGWPALVGDIADVSDLARSDHPGLPLVLLGHSMGSFAAQQYVVDHAGELAGLALTGTASIDLLEPALDLSAPIDLSGFNAPFAPARTGFEWLSRDDAEVDAYVADPLCGFGIDLRAGQQMFAGARPLADPTVLQRIRSDLPVFIGVGAHDPVNGGLALLTPLVDRYQAAGVKDVDVHVYPDARHEVFNEINRDEVTADLLTWLDRVVPRG